MKSPWTLVLRGLLLYTLVTDLASAAAANYRYYRFRATSLRGITPYVQLSEFRFFNGTAPVTNLAASDPSPGSSPTAETAPNSVDGSLSTKWLDYDFTKGALLFDFGTPTVITAYNYYTANDAPERDPSGWELAGTNDPAKLNWTVIDTITGFIANPNRFTIATPVNFVLPEQPPPSIEEFQYDYAQDNIVINGGAASLLAYVSYSLSADISSDAPGSSPVPVSQDDEVLVTVRPPANALTAYTLTARGSDGNITRSLPVRTVAGANLTYRYLRFTPIELAKGGSSINLGDFEFKNGNTAVPVAAISNPGGAVVEGKELSQLIDDPSSGSEWTSSNLAPVIFDFGAAPVLYSSYSFTTGNTAGGAPVKWIMEGSSDGNAWTLVENVYFRFNSPLTTQTATGNLPFSGTSLVPFTRISTNIADSEAGEDVILSWKVLGAAAAAVTPDIGAVAASGSMTISPAVTTTYAISATGTTGYAGQSAATLNVFPSIPSSFTYANFNDPSLIATTGFASVLDDYPHFTAAGDVNRIRLTDTNSREQGTAWYKIPLMLQNGFDTSFDAFIANLDYFNGAEGMAFVVQATPETTAALNNGTIYLPDHAVTVALTASPAQAGGTNYASLQVFKGGESLAAVNLAAGGLNLAHGYQRNYLADYLNPAAIPYHLRVVYVNPGALSVFVDNVQVIAGLSVNLEDAGAVDAKGRSYVGFTGLTGGLAETHDVTAWSMATTAAPVLPLAILSATFDTAAKTLALTWSSVAGKTYRITQSTDLATWTQVPGSGNVLATSASSNANLSYDATAARGFFRVEEVTVP
jgi:hypothetical protein